MPIKGFMIDVQGTLIDDIEKKPIAGSLEAIASLKKKNIPFLLVTNNTKLESVEFRKYLRKQGFDFDDEQYIDPLMVLESTLPPCVVAAYGTEPFLHFLKKRGYVLDCKSPEAVLLSIKESFCSDEFASMIEVILSGADLIGMHETSIYAKNGKRYPGVGALLKMLSFATGCSYKVVGKPSRDFYNAAMRKLHEQDSSIEFGEVVMISDDLFGDLGGAKKMGMRTALVLSGKIASFEEARNLAQKEEPDWIVSNVLEWFKFYDRGAA